MTARDFVRSVHLFRARGLTLTDLASRSIADMMALSLNTFQHAEFQALDAEDTVYQLCLQFLRSDIDFIPVVDPDTGGLVSVSGCLDIIFLLSQISIEFPNLFEFSIQQLSIGIFGDFAVVQGSALLPDVLNLMDESNLKHIPVLEEGTGKLIGLYQRSDMGFITKSADPDAVISGFSTLRIDSVVRSQTTFTVPTADTGPQTTSSYTSHCYLRSTLKEILDTMINSRSSAICCVDDVGKLIGIVSIRDIISYYCHS